MIHISGAGWGLFALYLLQAIGCTTSIDACPSTTMEFDITTTENATGLATALNCSGGGTFEVAWQGTVIVNETIALTDGSVVTITGVGSDAVLDGNGTSQLLTVRNSTLYLHNVRLENGYGSGGDVEMTDSDGGAVWASGADSVVSCSGTTTFHNNIASDGGALSIVDGATASWVGQTNFTRNYVTRTGGALYSDGAAIIFAGETTFADNSASYIGGAIFAEFSEVSWSGVTSFDNNTLRATNEGGSTIQVQDSNISWQGETSFSRGYGGNGGAIRSFRSNIYWEGETTFRDNVADLAGGALSIEGFSNVSWTGETSFNNNTVLDDRNVGLGLGGALYVLLSVVSWDGTTSFTNNTVHNAGGAVYAEGEVGMAWGGTTTFENNTSSSNGGAVAIIGEVSLNLGTVGTDLLLTGNVAGLAGGAVFQSSTTFGLTWNDVRFVSNFALNGGAVYSVGSGTASTNKGQFPNVYVDSIFCDNTAAVSGGAVESAAGRDDFADTHFEGNTAGALGGSLRLAGTTSITRCDFVRNGADEAGPAVANLGTITVVNSSFTDNSLLCAPGAFLNYKIEGNTTQMSSDYYDSVCEGCLPCSGDCLVEGNGTQECIAALENTKSTGVNEEGVPITLQTLNISSGYWRAVPTTTIVRPCWNEDACRGGLTDDTYKCAAGYKGPYCAICEDEYSPTLAYTCSECSNGEGIAFGVVGLLVALVALAAVVFYLASQTHDTRKTRFRRLFQTLPLQGLKTVVVAWQILTQFDSVANVTYAGVYGDFLDGISSIISLDLGLVLSAGCMARTDFHDRLLVSTLGPLLALGALGVSFKVAARRSRGSQDELQAARRKHVSMALLVTFIVYSSVSSTVFRVFDCETLEDDREYLRADYSIECTTAKHKALEVYAGFMIILYPVGIPVLYGAIVFNYRKILQDGPRRSAKQSADLEVTADLWKSYKPTRYYYEVVECMRRVTLTGVVVFIYPNTAAQVAVTLMLAFVFVMVSESLAPYASKQDAWMSRVAHVVVFTSMFQALVLKVDVSDESSDSQQVFGGVLLAANIFMVSAVIAEAAMVVCSVCGGGDTDLDETVAPGIRNTTSTRSVVDTWDMLERESAPTAEAVVS